MLKAGALLFLQILSSRRDMSRVYKLVTESVLISRQVCQCSSVELPPENCLSLGFLSEQFYVSSKVSRFLLLQHWIKPDFTSACV